MGDLTGIGDNDVTAVNDNDVVTAYALLLERPELDINQFAGHLGYSLEATRKILDGLAAMSLISWQESETGPLVAVSPIYAMQRLINQEKDLLEERREFLRRCHETLCRVLPSYHLRGDTDDTLTEQIHSLPSIRRRLEELALSARTEVLSFSPTARNPTESRPLDLDVLTRGVRMRTIYLDTVAYDTDALAHARELVEASGKVRVSPSLPTRMVIVDRRTAVIPMNPLDSTEGCLVIHHPGAVIPLLALFEAYWKSAVPLSGRSETGAECAVTEQAILTLLAGGAKDEAVARQLGMSVRTVRRHIADLMSRAGASSRFELGVRAVANRWLCPVEAGVEEVVGGARPDSR